MNSLFSQLITDIHGIGRNRHENHILEYAELCRPLIKKTIRDLPKLEGKKAKSALVVSAGPSVHRRGQIDLLKQNPFPGSLVAVDGSLIKCLKNGIVPDYVLTLDPHPTRVVRWFGDPNFEEHTKHDDYFNRQDLDVEFRKNSIKQNQDNIELINKYAPQIKLVIASSAPPTVTKRAQEAGFDMYWWNPLVDNPQEKDSITRRLYEINRLPCFNTGGNVGTASWVFANSILKIKNTALIGVDLGYYHDTPIEMTQTYYELHEYVKSAEELRSLFPQFEFPLTQEKFYTDPTYFWYRKNFLDLLQTAKEKVINCTEAGTFFGEGVELKLLKDFLQENS